MKNFNLIFVLIFAGMFVIVMTSLTNKLKESNTKLEMLDSQKQDVRVVEPVNNHFNLSDIPKPLVNYDYFEALVNDVKVHREHRLISLDTFLVKSKDVKTVILDTRSKEMYDLKHVKGALHLNFSDFTLANLNKLFSDFDGVDTQILIYCNNNFYDSFELLFQDIAFVSKAVRPVFETSLESNLKANETKQTLALNIPTFINLYGYGYQNVYELHEFVDVHDPRIEFEGTFDDDVK